MKLFEPLEIRGLRLENRLVAAPLASASCTPEGIPTERTLEGGRKILSARTGLAVLEHHAVHPWGRVRVRQLMLDRDDVTEGHRPLAGLFAEAGVPAVVQLNHGGSGAVDPDLFGDPAFRLVAPSPVPHPGRDPGRIPEPLSEGQIRELPGLFVEAARRAREAGYRGVQVHGCHGYLLGQFLSPLTNRRTDRYGGDLSGRSRLLRDVVDAVRGVFPDLPLGVRLGAADTFPGEEPRGLRGEESVWVARELAALGADWIAVSGNLCGYDAPGGFGPYAGAIREALGGRIPVECTGGVTTYGRARELLDRGCCDLVGVGRLLLSDPAAVGAWRGEEA